MAKTKPDAAPVIERGEDVSGTIFRGGRRALTKAELTRQLAPTLAQWIKATCLWDDSAALGDSRFLVFSVGIAPKVELYVQFWAEPGAGVAWEVSSGEGHPPTARWLAGERVSRIEALGFSRLAEDGNFGADVDVRTSADVTRIAKTVVAIFHDGFGYRGQQPVEAYMAYESRAVPALVYDGFTPEDLLLLLHHCGFEATVEDETDQAATIVATRRGLRTAVTCIDPVEEEGVYLRALLSCNDGTVAVSSTLMFEGGVTADWVVRRLEEWDAAAREVRKQARAQAAQDAATPDEQVH